MYTVTNRSTQSVISTHRSTWYTPQYTLSTVHTYILSITENPWSLLPITSPHLPPHISTSHTSVTTSTSHTSFTSPLSLLLLPQPGPYSSVKWTIDPAAGWRWNPWILQGPALVFPQRCSPGPPLREGPPRLDPGPTGGPFTGSSSPLTRLGAPSTRGGKKRWS